MTNEAGQFWHDVIEAHKQVSVSHERSIEVERDNQKATVFYDNESRLIVIEIEPAKTESKEARIVPV